MLDTGINFTFPFNVDNGGNISAIGGDDAIRAKIVQLLFTSPGERVHQPEYGCGLLDLVFDLNDPILAASVEFTIGQSLTRWLSDEIRVEGVNVVSEDEYMQVEVAYISRKDMNTQAVKITFK